MKIKHALAILIATSLILGNGSTTLVTAQAPAGIDLRVLSSDSQAIVLELIVPDFQIETIDHEGQMYHRFTIPGMVQTRTPGDPQVPTRGTFLGVPSTERVSIEVVEADYETLSGYRLFPAPAAELIGDNIVDPADIESVGEIFTLNQERYATDAFYPGGLAEIGATGALRDQAVASVRFYPVQYNPVSGEVRLYRRIVARVTWSTSLSLQAAGPTRRASPTYEKVLRNTLLNYDGLDRSAVLQQVPSPSSSSGQGEIGPSASTDKLKIGITEDGIYQLNPGDLGSSLSGASLGNIKMENRGAEIPIYVHDDNSNDAFDGDDYILFYGTAITDVYTTKNIYWLEEGSSPGVRMSVQSVPLGSASLALEFPTTLHAEEDTHYWVVMPEGEGQDHWFWGDYLNIGQSRDYSLTLNNVSKTGGSVTVRVRLHGRTAPDHTTQVYLNGVEIDNQTWSGQVVYDHGVAISDTLLIDGLNTVTVEAVNIGLNQFYVNWIEMDYRDTYVAENNELLFGAPSASDYRFEVTEFTTHTVQVFDVTVPTNVAVLTDTTIVADGGYYKVQFEDTAGTNTRYLALTPARRKSPDSIELDEPSDLKGTNNGHYIIITHEDFYGSALALAAHRSSWGVTAGKPVATVKVEDIYDEFNYGIFNPQAIRDFISYADNNWGGDPAYVLLLGGASYDYRDLLSLDRDNFVPTQMIETSIVGQTPSDNWFVTDDILPYMFIGRLTAQSSAEAADMVNKTIYYEQNPPEASWYTDALFVADDGNPSDGDNAPAFENNSDDLTSLLPAYYTANKVYLGAGQPDPPHPTEDIINYINNGSLLVNYAGHGNVDFWAQEKIMEPSDVASLNNTNRLPVVTVATCLNGYFAGKNISMAEEFLKRDNRGAVAVWADAGEGTPVGNQTLLSEFYDAIFQDDLYALGMATTAAKITAYDQSSAWGELVETFALFGDPATPLGLPLNYPYVESTTPVHGASDVPIDQDIRIVFSKPMSPTTVVLSGPGTTGLVFTPTWSAEDTVLDFAHTDFGYGQTLTFTINGQDNLGNSLDSGLVPSTWSFTTIVVEPRDVVISGPTTGITQTIYTFTADVSPSTAALPITYTWQATEQTQEMHTGGGLSDMVDLTWNVTGTKTITVTATNSYGTVTDTHTMTINDASQGSVFLPIIIKND
jgi:hypothetical protein